MLSSLVPTGAAWQIPHLQILKIYRSRYLLPKSCRRQNVTEPWDKSLLQAKPSYIPGRRSKNNISRTRMISAEDEKDWPKVWNWRISRNVWDNSAATIGNAQKVLKQIQNFACKVNCFIKENVTSEFYSGKFGPIKKEVQMEVFFVAKIGYNLQAGVPLRAVSHRKGL